MLLYRHTATRLTAGSQNMHLAELPDLPLVDVCVFFRIQPLRSAHLLSGDEGIRTPGLRRAKAALSQLSYIPKFFGAALPREGNPWRAQVGLSGIEPETSPLSEARSNQLS